MRENEYGLERYWKLRHWQFQIHLIVIDLFVLQKYPQPGLMRSQ
jgi:hypothetical protein